MIQAIHCPTFLQGKEAQSFAWPATRRERETFQFRFRKLVVDLHVTPAAALNDPTIGSPSSFQSAIGLLFILIGLSFDIDLFHSI